MLNMLQYKSVACSSSQCTSTINSKQISLSGFFPLPMFMACFSLLPFLRTIYNGMAVLYLRGCIVKIMVSKGASKMCNTLRQIRLAFSLYIRRGNRKVHIERLSRELKRALVVLLIFRLALKTQIRWQWPMLSYMFSRFRGGYTNVNDNYVVTHLQEIFYTLYIVYLLWLFKISRSISVFYFLSVYISYIHPNSLYFSLHPNSLFFSLHPNSLYFSRHTNSLNFSLHPKCLILHFKLPEIVDELTFYKEPLL